jgi:hypothetical protein
MDDSDELRPFYEMMVSQAGPPDLVVEWPPKEGWMAEAYQAVMAGKIGFTMVASVGDEDE